MSFKFPKHARFRCKRCTLCCGDTEKRDRLILLLKKEVDHISKKALMSRDEFADKIKGFEPYVYQMKKSEDGKCIFLKHDACSIYEKRPLICIFYPFQLRNLGNNNYVFTYTKECSGIGKGYRLKKRFFERLFNKFLEHTISLYGCDEFVDK